MPDRSIDPPGDPFTAPAIADTTIDPGSAAYVDAWDAEAAAHRPASRRRALQAFREVFQVVAIAAVLFLGTRTVVQGREVRGPSMLPTYHQGQRLFITRYLFDQPDRGDVVVFHPPTAGKDDYIKRVIGVPGDRVTVRDGRVSVNGRELDESYVARGQTTCFTRWCDVTLGPGEYYVMGDNRPNSSDSRFWGPVTQGNIVGRARLLYYPFSEFGLAP